MTTDLTVALVSLIKEHGVDEFQRAAETATLVYSLLAVEEPKPTYLPRPRRVKRQRRKVITPSELAQAGDWTAAIGKYFEQAEKRGLTEVPMRAVVNYIVSNSERTSVTGSAYGRYIKAVESIGWARSFTSKNGIKARTFVKVG